MKRSRNLIVITLLLFVVLSGCSKLTMENYDKIKVGMDYPQVVSIISDPDKCDAIMGSKYCVWGNESKNITIDFIGDEVFVLSMNGL